MANKDKQNVKRFIQDVSVQAANDAYNRGGSAMVITVENITSMTDEQLNSLKAGDVVVKLTSNQKHTYTVSYKENNQGICLTYTDASCVETVSYDYTDGHWVYNSTDVTHIQHNLYTNHINIKGDYQGNLGYIKLTIIANKILTETDVINYIKQFTTSDDNALSCSGYGSNSDNNYVSFIALTWHSVEGLQVTDNTDNSDTLYNYSINIFAVQIF